jgi:hypothetical protein
VVTGAAPSTVDQWIRRTTTASVVLLAVIAGVVSFRHMHTLALSVGESAWTAALIPLSVDGMVVAASMTLLADSRAGSAGGLLPWSLLAISSAASLGANVAVAEPTAYGRVIAAWPSFALIGAYELLMRQVRNGAMASDRSRLGRGMPGLSEAATDAGLPQVTSRQEPAGGPRMAKTARRRGLDAELVAQARQVDAEHRARHHRPASAETLRVRVRVGTKSARLLKDLVRASDLESSHPIAV